MNGKSSKRSNRWWCVAGVFVGLGPILCSGAIQQDSVKVELLADVITVEGSRAFTVGVRFVIEPGTLQPNRPLQIQVDTSGFRVDQVAIEFSGVDMNMGLIRNDLSYSSEGSFRGSAILPVCIRKRMSWRAIVNAEGDDGVHRASFDFEVYRP